MLFVPDIVLTTVYINRHVLFNIGYFAKLHISFADVYKFHIALFHCQCCQFKEEFTSHSCLHESIVSQKAKGFSYQSLANTDRSFCL